jgi:HEAT repeat protein
MGQRCKKAWLKRCLGTACASFFLSGCAGFWDEVTSNNFDVHHLFEKPNPFVVLQNSTDGNERAKALRALSEPRQDGGTDRDQEAVINILTAAATKEKQFLCRMAAIESLGKFKDPRAVNALIEAFYSSGSFAPDLALRIQTQSLVALGETHQPPAAQFLIKVVREKPRGEGSELERQQIMDVRIAASRALGQFHDPTSLQTLQDIVQTEKDVALHDSAEDALQLASGKGSGFDWKTLENLILPASAKDPDPTQSARMPSSPKPAGS